MTLPQPQSSEHSHDDMDLLLRTSRRALFIVLLMILAFGATVLGRALWPDSVLATWTMRMPWLLPVLIALMVGVMRFLTGGRTWGPNSPEVKKIQQDEFRRMNLARAQRVTLIVVLILQVPLGLLFAYLPGMRAVVAMGTATITLGMVVLIGLFLVFDRE